MDGKTDAGEPSIRSPSLSKLAMSKATPKVHQKEVNENIFATKTSFQRIFWSLEERPMVLSGFVGPLRAHL